MGESMSYRESHVKKGHDYSKSFEDVPHQAMVWQLERRVLDRIVAKYFPKDKPRHFDFACGTGRILGYLADRVRTSTGVDVSDSMLSVARQAVAGAEILKADITHEKVLEGRSFDLITAFRFFPNAEPSLRAEAIGEVVLHLDTKGILVFNNHMNTTSLRRAAQRLFGRRVRHSMSKTEVVNMVNKVGLQIVEQHPMAILPLPDNLLLLPPGLVAGIETMATILLGWTGLAQNTIYICRKSETEDKA